MKCFKIVAFAIVALLLNMHPASALGAYGGDMETIEGRMYNNFLKGTPSKSEVAAIIKSISGDGGFSDIDYKNDDYNTGGQKSKHFNKTLKLVKAYLDNNSPYYNSEELRVQIEELLQFWLTIDPEDGNWWHRSIGFPKNMMATAILMKDTLKQSNPKLLADLIEYLRYSWEDTPPKFMTGANGTDVSQVTFAMAVLADDKAMLAEVMEFVDSLIFIAKGGLEEGIYPDYSFSQHCGSGRQLYLGTYGREYITGLLFFMEFTNGTEFAIAPEKVTMLEDLITYGVAWMWYKGELDPNQCGRKIFDKDDFAGSYIPITERFIALDLPKKADHKEVIAMMKGKRELTGNRAYPFHDYMIHRGEGYMTTVRMTSTRTVGNEAGNGQGFENYHTGDGATYFKVHGNEYSPIFPIYNWRQIPGTTVVVDSEPMPRPMWGRDGVGGNPYAAVASTGTSGVAGFIFQKDQMMAHKAYFNFPELTVALGAGITTDRTDAPVITTLNQTTLKGEVAVDGAKIWHNKIGYVNLAESQIKVDEDSEKSILMISIDHGTAPKDDSYAYAVYPNISQEELKKQGPSVEILSNNQDIQAVRCLESGEIQAIFYKAGALEIDKKTSLEVSQEAAIILTPTKGGYNVKMGDPYCENGTADSIAISVKKGGKDLLVTVL